jgi:membrane-bound metal-dependent hydrolase YbcI (DUF457 family)
LIDIEPLYFMVTHQFPLHRFFHTYIGAALVAVVTIALFVMVRWIANRTALLPNTFHWQDLSLHSVTLGAFIGTFSHVALDSVMHQDIRPFAPFSAANPLLHVVPVGTLHWICLLAAAVGVGLLAARKDSANLR